MDVKAITVLGPRDPGELGLTDAHNHLWISDLELEAPLAPRINLQDLVLRELQSYRAAGGRTQIDCQPGGAGRDGNILRALAEKSGVQVICCTGFHLREYYPRQAEIWELGEDQVADYFLAEIQQGLEETRKDGKPVFPGFIKIAVRDSIRNSPLPQIKAAVEASRESGLLIEMHTEKGKGVESFLDLVAGWGMDLERLVVCHIDKRPDFGLHRELAEAGCLLEYDTFFRPKYQPEENVWPLIGKMVQAGLSQSIACATDLADWSQWTSRGGSPGLEGFPAIIQRRLEDIIPQKDTVAALLGGNIAWRLPAANKEKPL